MRASEIRLNSLKTLGDHLDAIESIETDYKNHYGGLERWNSGYETIMMKTAKDKVNKIEARMERLF